MQEIAPFLLIIFLILLNGTFVAAEFAFARLRKTQVDHIAESPIGEYPKGQVATANLLQVILRNMNDYISTCQVGITVASLSLGALAEVQVEKVVEPLLEHVPFDLDVHLVSITVAVIIVTYFHVVVGEVVPKTLALAKPEAVAYTLAHFISFIHTFFRLPVWFLNGSALNCLRLIGIKPFMGEVAHSEEEIKRIVSTSQEEGILEEEEKDMIQNIFEFTDTVAREIMTPRTDMACFSQEMTIEEAVQKISEYRYSRYPIYKDKLDNITGYITIRDVFKEFSQGKYKEQLSSISDEIIKVSDGLLITELMKEMQKQKKQIAILIDEFGGTSGLVTVEDIVEEIFGEIQDETEKEEISSPVIRLSNGDVLVDGLLSLEDLNEEIGANFVSGHFDTIGGLVFGLIGSDPKKGDQVDYEGFTFIVEKHGRQRVRRVRIKKKELPPSEENPV